MAERPLTQAEILLRRLGKTKGETSALNEDRFFRFNPRRVLALMGMTSLITVLTLCAGREIKQYADRQGIHPSASTIFWNNPELKSFKSPTEIRTDLAGIVWDNPSFEGRHFDRISQVGRHIDTP